MSGDPAETTLPVPAADARARLQRLAYTILSPSLGRRRRTLIADVAVDRAINDGEAPGATYPDLRERVVRQVLTTGRRRTVLATRTGCRPRPPATARPDPTWLVPAARVAYALRHLEGLDRAETHRLLAAAGVGDPATATRLAERIRTDAAADRR